MSKLVKPLKFEWDTHNQDKNQLKHQVEYKECEEVYANIPIYIFPDHKHSSQEKRYLTLGITNSGRLLTIIFTLRLSKIRVISARDMNKRERKYYEDKIK